MRRVRLISTPGARPFSVALSLVCALAIAGCDDKAEEKPKEDKPKSAEKEKEKEKEGDDKEKAKEEGGESDDKEEIDSLKAELAAAKEEAEAAKALDPEAAKHIEEAPKPEDEVAHEEALKEGEKGPVSVAKTSFTEKKMYGDRGLMYELSSEVTINEVKDGGVYAKASCVMGDDVFIYVGTLGSKHGEMGKMKTGETKRLKVSMFTTGLASKPARCQLSYDYGARDFSKRIADECWDGNTVTTGKCKDAITPKKSGDGKVVPFGFAVKTTKAMGRHGPDATSVNVSYNARFNEHLEKAPHLHLKTACKVGDRTWVEVRPDLPHVKPFSLENGEVVPAQHGFFFMNPLPGKPEACNLEVFLDGGYKKPEEKLGEACWQGGNVSDGVCEFHKKEAVAAAALSDKSLSVDEIAFTWNNHWKDKAKVLLNVRMAATVNVPISGHVQLRGVAECGKTKDKEHYIGPDLKLMGAGETVGIQLAAFSQTPLDKTNGKCELAVTAGAFGDKNPIEVARFCLKGDKVNPGKCKGNGKPPAIGTEVAYKGGDKKK